jgi:molecular chaperone GrpE
MTKNNLPNQNIDNAKELTECCRLKDEYLKGWQRARADYDNYLKEEKSRQKNLLQFSQVKILMDFLPLLDNYERALKHIAPDQTSAEFYQGLKQIQTQFESILKEQGIEEVKALGAKFDPRLHEALDQVEAETQEPETVMEVLEKGYLFNGQLLRPSKVKITK